MTRHTESVRFSIVVPAYNEAEFLGSTLRSLQAQDYPGPYEIIVVDNNSTDDTAAVAASHGVRVVHEAERGVCAARQRGSQAAVGEIIVSTDADTFYPSDWLGRIDQMFGSGEQVIAVGGPCRYCNPTWWMRALPGLLFVSVQWLFALTGAVLYISAANVAFRRAAFPGYDTRLTQGGDELDLLRKLRKRGRVVWDRANVVSTSPRRLEPGLSHAIVVSLFVEYLLAYGLNRLTRRRAIGTARAYRVRQAPSSRRRRRVYVGVAMLAVAILVGLVTFAGPGLAAGYVSVLRR